MRHGILRSHGTTLLVDLHAQDSSTLEFGQLCRFPKRPVKGLPETRSGPPRVQRICPGDTDSDAHLGDRSPALLSPSPPSFESLPSQYAVTWILSYPHPKLCLLPPLAQSPPLPTSRIARITMSLSLCKMATERHPTRPQPDVLRSTSCGSLSCASASLLKVRGICHTSLRAFRSTETSARNRRHCSRSSALWSRRRLVWAARRWGLQ